MENKKISYMYTLIMALFIPLLQIIVYSIRFRRLPLSIFIESFVFFPMGLMSSLFLIFLLRKCNSKNQIVKTFLGFLIALPIALFLSITSGLFINPIIGVTFLGSIPLVVGSFIGYVSYQSRSSNFRLIVMSIAWVLLLYPSIFFVIFEDFSNTVTFKNRLDKIVLLPLPIEIVICLILAWVSHFKKNLKFSNFIVLIPLINIIIFVVYNIFF